MSNQLVQLDHRLWFPDPQAALDEPEGLLAIGGDLRPERLLLAYQMGIFPWFEADQRMWMQMPMTTQSALLSSRTPLKHLKVSSEYYEKMISRWHWICILTRSLCYVSVAGRPKGKARGSPMT